MQSYEKFLDERDEAIIIIRDSGRVFINKTAQKLLAFFKNLSVQRIVAIDGGYLLYIRPDSMTESQSVVLHQLKTPLVAIRWITETLLDNNVANLTEHQKEMLNDIHQTNQFAINFVNDLLSAVKFETGLIRAKPTATDIIMIIQSVIKMLKPAAAKKKQNIILETSGQIKQVFIDSDLFTRVIQNLIDNAINYGAANSDINIRVSSDTSGAESRQYLIIVHNEGVPISDADKEKLFSKFYRGDAAKKINPSGTGLGLFIAKSAVEANGGQIWFESSADKGTAFYFTVPA